MSQAQAARDRAEAWQSAARAAEAAEHADWSSKWGPEARKAARRAWDAAERGDASDAWDAACDAEAAQENAEEQA